MQISNKFYCLVSISIFLIISCENYDKMEVIAKIPQTLEEVSGIQYDANEDAFWMLNDSGNSPSVFLVNEEGKIIRELKIKADNNDWEDITMDSQQNLYIGDFGNNDNKRKSLQILQIERKDLKGNQEIKVEKIKFSFPNQKKISPKKRVHDIEGFFEWKGNFYLFTKSRVKTDIGRTVLFKVPNKKGKHKAEYISDFRTCPEEGCWITAADINKNGNKVVILNHKSAWVFTDFKSDNFFNGKVKEFPFGHSSKKEAITFKDSTTIFMADEYESKINTGRNLYSYKLLYN